MIDPGGLLARLYTRLHLRTYHKRLQAQVRFDHARIISVGNLSMGGTGKTPLTMALAEAAIRRGIATLVVLRGYSGKRKHDPMLVSDGTQCLATYQQVGDEAMLFARLQGLKVAVGRNRAACIKEFGMQSQLILLDDAFQNPSVARQHELVLLDSSVPFSALRIFPAGHFREGLAALQRAHTVILTRVDQTSPENLQAWQGAIQQSNPALPIIHGLHHARHVEPALPTQNSKPVSVGIFSGIGNPASFEKTVRALGYQIQSRRIYKDHYHFTSNDLQSIFNTPDQPALPWLTTEKDFMRLQSFLQNNPGWRSRLHTVPIRMQLKGTSIDALLDRLTQDPI